MRICAQPAYNHNKFPYTREFGLNLQPEMSRFRLQAISGAS
jgi:hypothetical protein